MMTQRGFSFFQKTEQTRKEEKSGKERKKEKEAIYLQNIVQIVQSIDVKLGVMKRDDERIVVRIDTTVCVYEIPVWKRQQTATDSEKGGEQKQFFWGKGLSEWEKCDFNVTLEGENNFKQETAIFMMMIMIDVCWIVVLG